MHRLDDPRLKRVSGDQSLLRALGIYRMLKCGLSGQKPSFNLCVGRRVYGLIENSEGVLVLVCSSAIEGS